MIDLTGKNVIVTGAARGLGEAFADSISRLGADVLGVDISFPSEKQYNYEMYEVDLTKLTEDGEFVKHVSDKYDKVDVIINNAGITLSSPIEKYDLEKWRQTFDINVQAPFMVTKCLLRLLKNSESASIINISSLNSVLAFPDNPAYVASKSAVSGLTRSLALDLGKFGIRVNSLSPGYIRTAMTEKSWANEKERKKRQDRTCLGRWGTVEDLIGPVLFLSSDMSRYITGQSLFVDGGWTIRGL